MSDLIKNEHDLRKYQGHGKALLYSTIVIPLCQVQ